MDDELLLGDHLTTLAGCLWMSGDGQRAREVLDRVAGILRRRSDPTLALLRRIRLAATQIGRRPSTHLVVDMGIAHETAVTGGNHFGAWFSATTAALAALAAGDGETALHWSSVSPRHAGPGR